VKGTSRFECVFLGGGSIFARYTDTMQFNIVSVSISLPASVSVSVSVSVSLCLVRRASVACG